ncbi:PLP-dependent aminotransferase family protein [Sphingomonas morindae]|uniref:PLP-dependent aminotransferase family protein n=1 Tax=Sphingomonas morindae TaxID=1541170 RepID=A0ABY4X405_9SPHN|nr:PLP-dependent aminotransferase family protein [Sphingomonas morindae]USI71585.1 PLP-dependent aminotransferase family protein [Sphingomonas morindae]
MTDQIRTSIRDAIMGGTLAPGARLPSWQDLSIQLGVSRGTVRAAYEGLIDEQLLVSAGAAGTHVAPTTVLPRHITPDHTSPDPYADLQPSPGFFADGRTGLFQLGLPAVDAFPAKLWARIHRRAADAGATHIHHQDPRGHDDLRREIAAHLAVARGLQCASGQIFVTTSFRGAMGLIMRAVGGTGQRAWVEEPGFPVTRYALQLAGIAPIGIPVDAEGIDVAAGVATAGDAALAVVTPGQQAPLGYTLSPHRRQALLDWAEAAKAWIVEDDYLGELQLETHAAPALAGQDRSAHVIYVGSFSKTVSPSVGIGFIVAPERLVIPLMNVAAYLAPPPGYAAQSALAAFLRDGHYLRHLRKMKRLYKTRRDAMIVALAGYNGLVRPAGLAIHLSLPERLDDVQLLRRLRSDGFSPSALSQWYASRTKRRGLMLGVTNAMPERLESEVDRLMRTISLLSKT